MECKLGTTVDKIGNVKELIETLWNVNKVETLSRIAGALELIETLWNVNIIGFDNGIIKMRINRNIVECKLKMFATEGAKKFQN